MEVIHSSGTSVNSIPRSRMYRNLKSSTVKWLRYVLFNSLFRNMKFPGSAPINLSLLSVSRRLNLCHVKSYYHNFCDHDVAAVLYPSTLRYSCRGCALAARPQNRIPPAGERASRALVTGRAVRASCVCGTWKLGMDSSSASLGGRVGHERWQVRRISFM
jgi:hypothetical protein